jgi:Fe-S cluster biogenesis protein NfuA
VELTDQERASRLTALTALIDLMRPSVQADGGDLVLVRCDVETGVVEVQLGGACSSCAISTDTLQGGVTRILKDRLPWVTEVIGGLDDSIDPEDSSSARHRRLRAALPPALSYSSVAASVTPLSSSATDQSRDATSG